MGANQASISNAKRFECLSARVSPEHLIMSDRLEIFIVPPQQEFRAEAELRESRIYHEFPTETVTHKRAGSRKPVQRTVPLIRGYISAEGKPRESKYLRRSIGSVERGALIRCVTNADRGHIPAREQFQTGDRVKINVGKWADVIGTLVQNRAKVWIVDVGMPATVTVHSKHMIRIDPG